MNEDLVHRVVEIETHAQTIYDTAFQEAQEITQKAEQEAQGIIEKARRETQAEAEKLIQAAEEPDEPQRILAQAEAEAARREALAIKQFERALQFVLLWVVGRG